MSKLETFHRKNLFDTFGFVPLKLPAGFDYEAFREDVRLKAEDQYSLSWEEIIKPGEQFIVPAYADSSFLASSFLVNFLDNEIQRLLGKNYFYLGSDASVFFAAGSCWHRDLAMRLPVLKINIYLDFDEDGHGCDFLIIPGSQLVDTSYSGLLQKGLAWPNERGIYGGFSEKKFFPEGSNPTDPNYSSDTDVIPSHCVGVIPGLAVAFNTAAIHAVKSSIDVGQPRRLITFICCANPADLAQNHFSRSPQTVKLSDDCLISEIYAMKAMELKRFGVSGYGEALQSYPDYIKKHGIDWIKIEQIASVDFLELNREDGKHEGVQERLMAKFLTQNIPEVENSFRASEKNNSIFNRFLQAFPKFKI